MASFNETKTLELLISEIKTLQRRNSGSERPKRRPDWEKRNGGIHSEWYEHTSAWERYGRHQGLQNALDLVEDFIAVYGRG